MRPPQKVVIFLQYVELLNNLTKGGTQHTNHILYSYSRFNPNNNRNIATIFFTFPKHNTQTLRPGHNLFFANETVEKTFRNDWGWVDYLQNVL